TQSPPSRWNDTERCERPCGGSVTANEKPIHHPDRHVVSVGHVEVGGHVFKPPGPPASVAQRIPYQCVQPRGASATFRREKRIRGMPLRVIEATISLFGNRPRTKALRIGMRLTLPHGANKTRERRLLIGGYPCARKLQGLRKTASLLDPVSKQAV